MSSTEDKNILFNKHFHTFITELKRILKYRQDREEAFISSGREPLKEKYRREYKPVALNCDENIDDLFFSEPEPDKYEPSDKACFDYSLQSKLESICDMCHIFQQGYLRQNSYYKDQFLKKNHNLSNLIYSEKFICSDEDWNKKWKKLYRLVKGNYKKINTKMLETDSENILLDILNSGIEEYSCYDNSKYSVKDVEKLGSNEFITPQLIEKYWGLPWNYEVIINNPNLTEEFVFSQFPKFINLSVNIQVINLCKLYKILNKFPSNLFILFAVIVLPGFSIVLLNKKFKYSGLSSPSASIIIT